MAKLKEKIISLFKNKTFLIGAASFLLPALVLFIVYIANGVHPFGDGQILVTDLWHQYYPFLCELQEKLKEGSSLLYSENIGMGINFWALIAYYCASPLNFLVMLVSKEALRDLVVVLVLLKVGFSGLFFSLYLKKVHGRYDVSTVAFSSLYALCGYVLGYYWNIMWHDCVALLPLVMLGVYSLIRENKWRLYIVSLAIAVISNFYIGFMVCIFTAIYFFTECAKTSMGFKQFLKKLGLIAVCSVISLGITAFMTIPAFNALQNTVSAEPKTGSSTEKSFFVQIKDDLSEYADEIGDDGADVVGRLASFNEPVPKEGLPNIFSGFICVILLGFFIVSKNIPKKEKAADLIMLIVLLLSLIISDIDIIWHGFHKPNMVPYRYAFVFSFALISLAYRTYVADFVSLNGHPKRKSISIICPVIISALVIACAWKEAEIATIFGCCAIALVYFVILATILQEKREAAKKKWSNILCAVIVLEVIINTVIAVPTVRTTTYSTYYYRGQEIEKLLKEIDADSTFGRIETSQEYILNDPALYGYKGVSAFTSTANANVSELMKKLAICGLPSSNRYYYETTSPLTNAFLGIEYIIFKNDMNNLNPYLEPVAEAWTEDGKYKNVIYQNTETLPIGFMVDENFAMEKLSDGNAFEIQNELFRRATGIEEDLFTRVPLKSVSAETTVKVTGTSEGKYTLKKEEDAEELKMDINYIAPDENSIYAYIDGSTISKVKILKTPYKAVKRKYIFPAGGFQEGEKFTFSFEFESTFKEKATMYFHVYSMNEALFEQGMEMLRDEPFEITKYESTEIEGSINVKEDGVFYTSIPYEKGWTLYVDGVKTEIEPYEDALISAKLTAGEHNIVLKYSPHGFVIGVITSVAMLGVFVLAIVFTRRRKNDGQNIDSSSVLQ